MNILLKICIRILKQFNFIVYCGTLDIYSGGSISLHTLLKNLKKKGLSVYWRTWDEREKFNTFDKSIKEASDKILKNSIVIYPEVVNLNPLNSRFVIRWLLNKPQFLNPDALFTDQELFFYMQKSFLPKNLKVNKNRELAQNTFFTDIYFNKNLERNFDYCTLIHKGHKYHTKDKIIPKGLVIDKMSHQEKADILNKSKYLISFDPYSTNMRYAVMCGCIPIIIPVKNLREFEWRSGLKNTNGIAYGYENLNFANSTRNEFFKFHLKNLKEQDKHINNFCFEVLKYVMFIVLKKILKKITFQK